MKDDSSGYDEEELQEIKICVPKKKAKFNGNKEEISSQVIIFYTL